MAKWLKNTVIYIVVRLLFCFIRLLGFRRALGFGRWLGRRVFRMAETERRRTIEHLSMAFEDMPETEVLQTARGVFEHLGMGVAEVVCADKIENLDDYIELAPEARRLMDDLLACGTGVIFVTGHCGNWELMARSLALRGSPINTIGKKSYDPRLTKLLVRFRRDGAVNTIWRGEVDIVDKMLAVIRRGEVMGFLIDQDTKVPGVFVEFFGKAAYTPSAATFLAHKTGSKVMTLFNRRRPEGGYLIEAEELVLSPSDDFEQAVVDDTQKLTLRIENHIRAYPTEWIWMHKRWKTRPPQEKSAV